MFLGKVYKFALLGGKLYASCFSLVFVYLKYALESLVVFLDVMASY